MFTQNINTNFQSNNFFNQIEKENSNINSMPSNDENALSAAVSENKLEDTITISSVKQTTPKTLPAPTKIYIDNVINNALDNISRGNNIEDNKRIVRLFSNLIRENPEKVLRSAYNL